VKRPAAFTRNWWQDWGLTAMLASLAIALFLGPVLEAVGILSATFVQLIMSLVLASGVVAISGRRSVTVVMAIVAFVTIVLKWANYTAPRPVLTGAGFAFGMFAISLLAALVLQHVFRAGPITPDRIRGAIVAYLLVGFFFVEAYQLVRFFQPGAFRFADGGDAAPSPQTLAYFSFATLTTVGYGDITPASPLARSLAVGEALIGQLFPAILIGGLVSMSLSTRDRA
jgi:voltage-gated potassium channel Kch